MDLSGHGGETPFPFPIPITSSPFHVGGGGGGHGQHPPPPLPTTEEQHHRSMVVPHHPKTKRGGVRYRECLKNHAASLGGSATDGCGEFMPSGEEGSLEALKCSACSCHRNFHRREVEGEQLSPSSCESYHHHHHHHLKGRGLLLTMPTLVMPLQASESDEMEVVKKRSRTKFTPEQKEKMLDFAERMGWRLQRQEEGLVQHFCQEIGVKRRVLKVWMHNNKHNLANKCPPTPSTASLQTSS